MIKRTITYTFCLIVWPAMLMSAVPSYAEQAKEPAADCTAVAVDYEDNAELSRAEKLMLMEQALYESLNKFECEPPSLSASSGSNSAASGGGSGAGNAGGNAGGGGAVASDSVQGTEAETTEMPGASSADAAAQNEQTGSGQPGGYAATNNGKIPDDIPPAANDDAVAAQIRLAAEAETDPETRKKLWNEYRKYKGMNIEH